MAGKSRRYEGTRNGLRMISALMVLRERILDPLIRGIVNVQDVRPGLNPTSLDQRYLVIREQMDELLREFGLAA